MVIIFTNNLAPLSGTTLDLGEFYIVVKNYNEERGKGLYIGLSNSNLSYKVNFMNVALKNDEIQ